MNILVTGASGSIGQRLVCELHCSGHSVVASSRSKIEIPGVCYKPSPELGPSADWSACLTGIDAVVHLAGCAQVEAKGGLVDYHRINSDGTTALARQAGKSGVKQFIFMSSAHAVAAESHSRITAQTLPKPDSAYGQSKLAAEAGLRTALVNTSCSWTVLRPPAVYGPANAANIDKLLKLVRSGIPLPLASVRNRRSFVYLGNLVDAVIACLDKPEAFGKIYFPSDCNDVSTPELIRAIECASADIEQRAWSVDHKKPIEARRAPHAMRHSTRLIPFPESLLKAAGRLPGLGAIRKLTSSLYVDGEQLWHDLGWKPPFTMAKGLRLTLAGH